MDTFTNANAPRVGDRVRYRPYEAVWNAGRGRSGELGTVAAVDARKVVVAPDAGGITDTVLRARAGGWPRILEPVA